MQEKRLHRINRGILLASVPPGPLQVHLLSLEFHLPPLNRNSLRHDILLGFRRQGLREVGLLSDPPSSVLSFLILQCLGLLSTLCLPEEGRGGSLGNMSITCLDVTLFLDTVSLYQFPVLLNSYFMVLSHFSSRRRMIDSQIGALGGLLVSGWGLLKSSLYIHFYVKYNHLAFALRTRAIRILITDTIVENDLGISHCYTYIQRR